MIKPTHVHIIVDGKIILSGGVDLLERVNKEGYKFLAKEYGVKLTKEKKQVLLESCGNKVSK